MSTHIPAKIPTKASQRHVTFSLDPIDTTDPGSTEATSGSDPSRNPFVGSDEGVALDARVEEALKHWHVPGCSLAIVDGHCVTARGYGVARVSKGDGEEGEAPVTPDTVFDIASMSKSFTAASVGLLVQDDEEEGEGDEGEEGEEQIKEGDGKKDANEKEGTEVDQGKGGDKEKTKLTWQTPVSHLHPEFLFASPTATSLVSLEDILSHRSGLPGHEESVRGIHDKKKDNPNTILRNTRNLPLANPVRTTYEYNNLLYTCAAELVTHLSGTPFASFLQQKFWDGLGMQRTWLGADNLPSSLPEKDVAIGHIYSAAQDKILHVPHVPEPEGIGAGGIQSTAPDVARWLHAHIHALPPLSPTSYTSLHTPRILSSEPVDGVKGLSPQFYCLGWETFYYHGATVVRHDGAWAGFVSSMLFVPALRWGFALLTNSEDAYPVTQELVFHLLDGVLGVPGKQRFDWRAYYDVKVPEWNAPTAFEEVFPEAEREREREREKERVKSDGDVGVQELDFATLGGTYRHPGYHCIKLELVSSGEGEAGGESQCLRADESTRAYAFTWRIRADTRAYGTWYVCDMDDPGVPSAEVSRYRCRFDVGINSAGEVEAKRFGVDLYPDTGDLIWFDKVVGQ